MMNLYLIQHGEPKKKEEDPHRPLSEKGKNDMHKVVAFVSGHKDIRVKNIIHSGKTRALQTAEIIGEYFQSSYGIKEVKGLDPLDDIFTWVDYIKKSEDDLVIVGHLPYLSKIASYLISDDESRKVVNFQVGGIVCLEKGESGTWSVSWMITPQIIPE